MEKRQNLMRKPQNLNKGQALGRFLCNPETGECCSRTPLSWLKIVVFYLVFYGVLVAFWSIMLMVFYQTIDNTEPKWQLSSSLIGTDPGLGFRPRPPDEKIDSTLIWFKHGSKGNSKYWIDALSEYLTSYEKKDKEDNVGETLTSCDFNKPPAKGKTCSYDITQLSEIACDKENQFGYILGQPCILIKMNKIFGWVPDVFKNASEVPDEMPEQLKAAIRANEAAHGSLQPMVWISCDGENPADMENIGEIEYSSNQGIPAYYFPFVNIKAYQSPLVAVKFKQPTSGVLINVECKAWAKNIDHHRAERNGLTHFELLMD